MKKNKVLAEQSEAPTDTPKIEYHHGVPVTRREMLAAGLLQFSASITLPSIYTLLARAGVAEAAEITCAQTVASDLPVYVEISLAGGAGLAANFVPHDKGLNPLPTYSILGLGRAPAMDRVTFGNGAPFAANGVSGFLTGFNSLTAAQGANPMTPLQTAMVGNPVVSGDDTNMNKLSIAGAVSKAGVKGTVIQNMGNAQSASGGRHQPAFVIPPAPLLVQSYADIANAITVSGSLANLGKNQKRKLFETIMKLNQRQARDIASLSGGEQLGVLATCSSDTNVKLVSDSSIGTNPLSNTAFSTVWGLTAATNPASRDMVAASMVYNSMLGNAGTVDIILPGYDYHDNPRPTTTAADAVAGLMVRRVLESARVMNKKVFVTVTTDGAVGAPASDTAAVNFSSDRGPGSVAYMFAYDPAKLPQNSGWQVGHFTNGQVADTGFITGTVEGAAGSMLANYLSFGNKLGDFEKVAPRIFTVAQLTEIVKIFG